MLLQLLTYEIAKHNVLLISIIVATCRGRSLQLEGESELKTNNNNNNNRRSLFSIDVGLSRSGTEYTYYLAICRPVYGAFLHDARRHNMGFSPSWILLDVGLLCTTTMGWVVFRVSKSL